MKYKIYLLAFVLFSFIFFSCKTNSEMSDSMNPDTDVYVDGELIDPITKLPLEPMDYFPGEWNGNIFSSKWYGFNFSGLESMKTIPEDELIDINAQQSRIFDGPGAETFSYVDMQIAYEVVSATEDQSTVICVLAEKAFTDNLTVEEYAAILQNELKITHGRNIEFEENIFTKIGKYDYYTLTAKINIDGQIKYKSIFLRRKNQRFATVLVNYQSRIQLGDLLTCFTPVEN